MLANNRGNVQYFVEYKLRECYDYTVNKVDEKLLKRFGKKISKLRKELRLSQEELATAAGLDRTYISGIERGFQNPSLRTIGRLAKALGVSISDLTS